VSEEVTIVGEDSITGDETAVESEIEEERPDEIAALSEL
jgi:hypothetical protein